MAELTPAKIHASAAVRLQILARARLVMTSSRDRRGRAASVGAGQMRAMLVAIVANAERGTLDQLADMAGLSRTTAWRAVNALNAEGVLISTQGSGGPGSGRGFKVFSHRVSWERLLELVPDRELPHLEGIALASLRTAS